MLAGCRDGTLTRRRFLRQAGSRTGTDKHEDGCDAVCRISTISYRVQ